MSDHPLDGYILWLSPPERLPACIDDLRRAAARPACRSSPGDRMTLPDEREADFDAYFGVRRSCRDPAGLLARALADTYSAVPGAADEPALAPALSTAGIPLPPPAPAAAEPMAAGDRWLHGHRLFFALIQGAVIGLRHASDTAAARPSRTVAGLEAADRFLAAAAGALRLTAAFGPQEYEETVRPSMTPPRHPRQGFSGLWSADHRILIDCLRDWGPIAAAHGAPAVYRAHQGLRQTLDHLYTAHIGICRRFVGDGPSLLQGNAPAAHTLETLAHARQHLLGPGHSPPRKT